MSRRALVTGAGGFIGHHLVARLRRSGCWVRGVDLKDPEFEPSEADDFVLGDLRDPEVAHRVCRGVDDVYALAADMGGMGFISRYPATIIHNNTLISANTLQAAHGSAVERYFLASSACVYPEQLQDRSEVEGLREHDAFPANPQDTYGWEKLLAEVACQGYVEEHGMRVRVARFHNIYGPLGTWQGGREKAPAAMCRKVASAPAGGQVEIWGDGRQTRSFCYVDNCLDGIERIVASDHPTALNLGSAELVTIDDLARLTMSIAGRGDLDLVHVDGPQGVRGRSSDNTLISRVLGWEPQTSLREGLGSTYPWIAGQVASTAVGR